MRKEVCEQGWSQAAERDVSWQCGRGGPGVRRDSTQGPGGLQPNRPNPTMESECRDLPFSQGLPMLLDPCPLPLG